MKNFIIFFLIVMVISFITPNLFIRDVLAINEEPIISNSGKNIFSKIQEKFFEKEKEEPKREEQNKIRLLMTDSNEIIELDFDEYIKGVLIGEMPVTYEIEALKAQALVARTYTLYKLKNTDSSHENADMCDDINCCQCYKTKEYAFASWDDEEENAKWLKVEEAVNSTKNQYITYNNDVIAAFFHANSAGKTEDVKYIWGEVEIPYLKSVEGFENDLNNEIKIFSSGEFENKIRTKYEPYIYASGEIKILDYTTSGRVNTLKIGENILKATELRTLLGLKSTAIESIIANDEEIQIVTKGYGHGVGMSQVGANQMALNGKKYDEIIKHYYTGVEIQTIS